MGRRHGPDLKGQLSSLLDGTVGYKEVEFDKRIPAGYP